MTTLVGDIVPSPSTLNQYERGTFTIEIVPSVTKTARSLGPFIHQINGMLGGVSHLKRGARYRFIFILRDNIHGDGLYLSPLIDNERSTSIDDMRLYANSDYFLIADETVPSVFYLKFSSEKGELPSSLGEIKIPIIIED